MRYYEVIPRRITGSDNETLTYHSDEELVPGQIVSIPLGRRSGNGVILSATKKPGFATKPLSPLDLPPLPPALLKTISWLADYYVTPLPVVLNTVLPRGLQTKRRVGLKDGLAASSRPLATLTLSKQQKQVVENIESGKDTVILHGETGSGKTLVYRELIKRQLNNGKSALLLVPEIGLTPQAAGDYQDLTEQIYVTHSGLSEAQRHKIWLNILQQKSPKLVIGPRSALFSPLENLGVVIIDEEHEPTYKQDVSPKYQTQTVAAFLTQAHGARLVLASATPRLQDMHLSQARKVPVVSLPSHFKRRPDIQIVDRTHVASFSRNHFLSDRLINAVGQTLDEGKQSLVYLNRRGSATLVLCSSCGWSAKCPHCDLGLILHHDKNRVRCHQCGYWAEAPASCPECSHPDIRYRGVGTKRLEMDLQKLFPQAKIGRFDSDTLKGNRLHERYQSLYDGEVDIIIGTQAVARSLDLPLLDTVGVVSADSELLLPDFSAAERAFQLLYQVIGRVGRTSGRGTVVIQTHNPDHPAIVHATTHDYDGFYQHEMKHRQEFGYPPHSHLLGLVVSYSSRERARSAATELASELQKESGIKVLGPTPAFYERRGKTYRWLIVVKSPKRQKLLQIAKRVRSARWQVDIDPTGLLF